MNPPSDADRIADLEAALDVAGKDFVAGHIHMAERSTLTRDEFRWLMRHLEQSFSRVRAALGRGDAP